MRTLVYISCFGELYKEIGLLCVQSLREFGLYQGDCLIITDQDIVTTDLRTKIWRVDQNDPRCQPPHLMRLHLGEWSELTNYHKVIYLDADQLVIKPIAPLFEQINDCITVCYDHVLSGLPTFASEYHNKLANGEQPSIWFYKIWALYFKAHELDAATNGCGINSGFFGLPSQCYDLLTYWLLTRKYVKEKRNIPMTNDQTALNFLLNNDLVKHKIMPPSTMLTQFTSIDNDQHRITPNTILLHFCGFESRLTNMTLTYSKLSSSTC